MIFKKIINRFYDLHPNAIVFWVLFLALYFPVILFLLASFFLIIFIFWPFQSYELSINEFESKEVVVISHGLKDDDTSWAKTLKKQILVQSPTAQVIALDWSYYADNALTCSVNGRRIGNRIAKSLLINSRLNKIKLIGHSCGAFVNYGICEVIKQDQRNIKVSSIYLDPVSIYGGVFWRFGQNNFGDCANDSVTYFDTEDGVPGSNSSPSNSEGVDITNLKSQFNYRGSPHQWPIYYYIAINK